MIALGLEIGNSLHAVKTLHWAFIMCQVLFQVVELDFVSTNKTKQSTNKIKSLPLWSRYSSNEREAANIFKIQ